MEMVNTNHLAARIVLYGVEGIGKSTWASKLPNPLFIDVEGSTRRMTVNRQTPASFGAIMQIISVLQTSNAQGYQTLVIDTIDWAERMCESELCDEHSVKGIEDFGYGKGYKFLEEKFAKFLDALTSLSERTGIHVVLLAHAWQRKMELPEEFGAFDHWEMKLSKKVFPLVKEWAEAVLFANYKTFIITDDKTKTKKAQGNEAVLYTKRHACWDAKNRFGLPDEVSLFNGFEHFRNVFTVASQPVTPAPAAPPKQDLATHPPAPAKVQAPAPTPAPAAAPLRTALQKLFEMMVTANITEEQIQWLISSPPRSWFPANTPLENLPDDFICGCLIPNWQRGIEAIKQAA